MKWMSLSAVAALALFTNACEHHTAEETRRAVAEDMPKLEEQAVSSESAAPSEAPVKTETAAPVAEKKPAEGKTEGGAKFFETK